MNKLQIVGLLLLITLVCPAWVQAQGKLGRARESVRRSKSKPAAQLQKENTDEDDDRNKQRKKREKPTNRHVGNLAPAASHCLRAYLSHESVHVL